MLALAVTVTSAVATLGMEASIDVGTDPGTALPVPGLETPRFDPVNDDAGEEAILRPVVYGLDALLLFVGLVNLVATLLLTTRERVRDLGVLGAVGMTPRQVSGSLVSEQVLVAVIAGLVGLPLGLLFFRGAVALTGGSDEFAYPSWWSLACSSPVSSRSSHCSPPRSRAVQRRSGSPTPSGSNDGRRQELARAPRRETGPASRPVVHSGEW